MGTSYPVIFGIILGVVTLCHSRPLNGEERKMLLRQVRQWKGSPEPHHLGDEGNAMRKQGITYYKFVFYATNGARCDAQFTINKGGMGGMHTFVCQTVPVEVEEPDYDRRRIGRRRIVRRRKSVHKNKAKRKTFRRRYKRKHQS